MARSKESRVSAENDAVEPKAEELQFPSDVGEDGLEVAKRTVDLPSDESTDVHRKVFVLQEGVVLSDQDHLDNIAAMRQYAVHQGLRPVEDGSFVGIETNVDGKSQDFIYELKVVPARVDNPLTHVRVEDQHVAENG